MSLAKFPFVFASTYLFSASFVRPNPLAGATERLQGPLYERALRFLPPNEVMRIMAWIPCIVEGVILLATNFPSPSSSQVLSVLLRNGQLPSFTPDRYVIAGAAITILGSSARLWAIRTLGRHFTHELSIRKDHKLVTDGPYSVVRHPSYTAALLASVGLMILHASPGSFVRACGWLESRVGKTLVASWVAPFIFLFGLIMARTRSEDGFLRAHFGVEWDKYAERTRYRLFPGLF
ncbi:ICMT-domain-containing protein [Leucogyrophana mollusca]|uniref:ICMT-domain-containing protein n=1 Tax=Leucogyrophana mollusca TaxID=85980 RepID=A0ACB8BR85_9AGAM|nr:ICMT-domain-containing protein [Leucogyrophana mollusca]